MSANERITIVLVNWNGQKWLPKCLDSLKAQTYKNLEIIVVDNNSSDGSTQLIKENYPGVKLIEHSSNVGFAAGNNLGVSQASGKFILLLNTDTWVNSDFVEDLMKYYAQNKFDVVAPYQATYEGKKHSPYISKIDPLGHSVYLPKSKNSDKNFYLTGVCLLVEKRLYQETGGLDENFFMYCEEVDWFWRLQLLGKKFQYIPDLYVNHAGAGSSAKGIQYSIFLWRNQNTLQMLLKNYQWQNIIWVLPLYLLQNLLEIVAFLVFLKPKIALSYIEGWLYSIKNLKQILERRREIQSSRKVGDLRVMANMYLGLGKLQNLISYKKAS
jgi:GT2 family glycosyltransferase